MKVGVLALQGAFALHLAAFDSIGVTGVPVRRPADLAAVDALVIPGGESTTISMLLESAELFGPIAERISAGMPVLGTCAGLILLADEVLDGRSDQRSFGAIDLTVRRNAFGRQIASFETDLEVSGMPGGPFPAVFIRAPSVERAGDGVEILARLPRSESKPGGPVMCRQGPVTVAAFHPELSGDLRIHQMFAGRLDC